MLTEIFFPFAVNVLMAMFASFLSMFVTTISQLATAYFKDPLSPWLWVIRAIMLNVYFFVFILVLSYFSFRRR